MINAFAKEYKLPSFRVKQFNLSYYKDLINSYDELTTWSKEMRDVLQRTVPFSTILPLKEMKSKDGGTEKVLFKRISDGKLFESVLMKHNDKRNTVCVSCMIGCPLGCKFCATGKMKYVGNLTVREIVDQVLHFARNLKIQNQSVTNIVFMGMGEPLLNFDNVMSAIEICNNPEYLGLGIRRITISTSGITPQIKELMKRGYKGRLVLSLHAPNQILRETIMPIAKKYSLPELVATVKSFAIRTQLRVSYEYILIDGLNDLPEHAHALVTLVGKNHPELTHINLIPYNPIMGATFKRSLLRSIHTFSHILSQNGVSNTIRVTMGDDIKAACGQLAGE